jgi:hypothetical protein
VRWIGFSSSLASRPSSSQRVAVWRRLRQLGALAPAGSLYLLPASEAHAEAFSWLAQEVEEAGGRALVVEIEELHGPAEGLMVEEFRKARDEDYRKLAAEAEEAASSAPDTRREGDLETLERHRETLARLQRRLGDIARIDFFQAPEGTRAASALARLEEALGRDRDIPASVPPVAREAFVGRRWVTRPRPHVDRLACAWLIRRFVDPAAEIRYGDRAEAEEVSFDMREAVFGHRGNHCTFEVMAASFGLDDPALASIAEIVHEIDLRDGRSERPEVAGVDRILSGWGTLGLPDAELERLGMALFEGLYRAAAVSAAVPPEGRPEPPGRRRGRVGPSNGEDPGP